MSKYNLNPFEIFSNNEKLKAFFSLNEKNKLELYIIDKDYYQNLPPEKQKLIKSNFLWSRSRGAWVGRRSIGYVPKELESWDIPYIQLDTELAGTAEKRDQQKERAERKAERLAKYAQNNYKKSTELKADFNHFRKDWSWLTQPNINSSRGRSFTNHRNRVLARYDKGMETYNKAKYLEERAKDYEHIASEKETQLKNFSYLENRIKENNKTISKIGDFFDKAEEALKNKDLKDYRKIDIQARMNYFKIAMDKLAFYEHHLNKANEEKKEAGEIGISEFKERLKTFKKDIQNYFSSKYSVNVHMVRKGFGTGLNVVYVLRADKDFPKAYSSNYANESLTQVRALLLMKLMDKYNTQKTAKTKSKPIDLPSYMKPKEAPKKAPRPTKEKPKNYFQAVLDFNNIGSTEKETSSTLNKTKDMGKIIKLKPKKTATKKAAPKKPSSKAKKGLKPLKKLPARLKGKATLSQLNRARKKGASISISKGSKRQTGSSSKMPDKMKKALAPGKRLTPSGNIYYESRKNRSDQKGKRI